jgi:uncharacterized protein YkwD
VHGRYDPRTSHDRPGGAHAARLVLPGPIGLATLVAALLITFGVGAALLSPSFAGGADGGSPLTAGQNGAADRNAAPPATDAPAPVLPTGAPGLAPTATAKPRPPTARPKPADKPKKKATTPSSRTTAIEDEVTALVNRERTRAGCGRVHTDERLRRASRRHSQDMADRNYFSHTTPDGRSPWDRAGAAGYERAIGENIAKGQRTPASVMSAWMNSDGHRRNILNCDARATGVGLAYDGGSPVWTQLFGAI